MPIRGDLVVQEAADANEYGVCGIDVRQLAFLFQFAGANFILDMTDQNLQVLPRMIFTVRSIRWPCPASRSREEALCEAQDV